MPPTSPQNEFSHNYGVVYKNLGFAKGFNASRKALFNIVWQYGNGRARCSP
jgi:hypothetical protein